MERGRGRSGEISVRGFSSQLDLVQVFDILNTVAYDGIYSYIGSNLLDISQVSFNPPHVVRAPAPAL